MGFLSQNNVRFINREAETRHIRRVIASSGPSFLGLHGPGGIGKTVLSWWTMDECVRQSLPCAYIDLGQFTFTDSVDVLRDMAGQLDRSRLLVEFWELLSIYHSHFQSRFLGTSTHSALLPADFSKVRQSVMDSFIIGLQQVMGSHAFVLIFDNLDAIGKPDRHRLEAEIFVPLGVLNQAKVIVVSRGPVQWQNPALESNYQTLHLLPFDEDYAIDLTRQLWPELLERESFLQALKVSRGHPYSVVRLTKAGKRYASLDEPELYQKLLEELWVNVISRFMLRGVSAVLQRFLAQISVVRFFDVSSFKYFSLRVNLLTEARISQLIETLDVLNYDISAVRFDGTQKGYRLQPPIRPVSLELHRISKTLDTLNQIALEFYADYVKRLPPGYDEWRRCVIELIYHHSVIGQKPQEAKNRLAGALAELLAAKDLEAAIKLRDELSSDSDLPPILWQDVFTYFQNRKLRGVA